MQRGHSICSLVAGLENLVEPVEHAAIEQRAVAHLAVIARAVGGAEADQLLRTGQVIVAS
jgi:hypothetical protein